MSVSELLTKLVRSLQLLVRYKIYKKLEHFGSEISVIVAQQMVQSIPDKVCVNF